jgi:ATP-dependent exoDNAse (exonuclease V) beta subunit
MYVAMTRARERLILSGSANFENWPGNPTKAIEWLGPALVPDLAARAAAAYGGGEEALVDGELVSGADGIAVRLTLNTAAALPTLLAATRGAADDARFASAAVPRASRVAVVAAPSATQLSYTALADYERCAYRYYLQRVLRMPDVAAPLGDGQAGGEDAALRGVYVHALLEQLDFAAPRPPGAAAHAAAERVAGAALADPVAAGELAFAFARSPLCARLAAAGDVRREAPFAFVFGPELLISGFFDAVGCESDGTLLVVDYKTDKLIPGEDLAAHVERDYSLQQLIYSLAALESGAASVEIAYCFLRSPEQVVCVRHVAADGDRLMAELRARQKPLRDGSFDVSPQPGWTRCSTCPGRARLCSHEEAATLAGGPAS